MWRNNSSIKHSDSEDEIISSYRENKSSNNMTSQQDVIKAMEAEIQLALQEQAKNLQRVFDEKMENMISSFRSELNSLKTEFNKKKEIVEYQRVKIVPGIECDQSLDLVKTLPEFSGKIDEYVAWREAATLAYEVFEPFDGSSRHFYAVGIIRNKIKGPASATLSSFNTVLNFKAIIARLDFTYADKTPTRVILQKLGTLRQGERELLEYYDEVEKTLTLLTNKTLMTHDPAAATVLNEQFRKDALHSFVAGLKKSLKTVVFSAQPEDLPSALSLAQEAEVSNEYSQFAASFAKTSEERNQKPTGQRQHPRYQNNDNNNGQGKNFQNKTQGNNKAHGQTNPQSNQQGNSQSNSAKQRFQGKDQQSRAPEPMEIDPSTSRFRQQTNFNRETDSTQSRQNVNFSAQEQCTGDSDYQSHGEENVEAFEDNVSHDSCNFLGISPFSRTSNKM